MGLFPNFFFGGGEGGRVGVGPNFKQLRETWSYTCKNIRIIMKKKRNVSQFTFVILYNISILYV